VRASLPQFEIDSPKESSIGIGVRRGGLLCALLMILACAPEAKSQVTVTGQVVKVASANAKPVSDASEVVVWLTPLADSRPVAPAAEQEQLRLIQRHKSFEPHLLVVEAGSRVQFPNEDPFFHNVFSLFDGKRFDLGLYEAGSSRTVLFDKPGICYLFCNIHPEMSAVVVVLKTPYYGVSGRTGQISILGVPAGRYEMRVWNERSLPEDLKALTREVTISESFRSLGTISLRANPDKHETHKNKYGRDYDNPTPPSSVYTQPQ
jgi:plastocyanin